MQKPALSFRFRPPALSLFLGRLGAALLVLLAPPAISEPPNPVELRGAMGVFARGSKSLTPGTEAALRVPSDRRAGHDRVVDAVAQVLYTG